MDPFEIRMQFISLIKRLNATQQSIQRVVGFAVKYFPPCGEDIWECIIDECKNGTINSRINILYFLDSLCDTCLLVKSRTKSLAPGKKANNQYVDFVTRDLSQIVESVVPPGREGLPNLTSTKQILERWRSKRVIDPQVVDEVVSSLSSRTQNHHQQEPTSPTSTRSAPALPQKEIIKRIEEDRERHKRLRESRWVQPVSHNPLGPGHAQTVPLAAFMSLTSETDGENEISLDIEFDNEWETTSDWNEDDEEACGQENDLCFPRDPDEDEVPMDLS